MATFHSFEQVYKDIKVTEKLKTKYAHSKQDKLIKYRILQIIKYGNILIISMSMLIIQLVIVLFSQPFNIFKFFHNKTMNKEKNKQNIQ